MNFKLSLAIPLLGTMLLSAASAEAQEPGIEPVVPLEAEDITRMFPHSALKMEGAAAGHNQLPKYMAIRWVLKCSHRFQDPQTMGHQQWSVPQNRVPANLQMSRLPADL